MQRSEHSTHRRREAMMGISKKKRKQQDRHTYPISSPEVYQFTPQHVCESTNPYAISIVIFANAAWTRSHIMHCG